MSAHTARVGIATIVSPASGIAERALDLVHLSRQTLGDRALELELIELFDKQAGHIMTRLDSELCGSSVKWRSDLSHTLKGSARAIGAFKVAAAAQAYEDVLQTAAPGQNEVQALKLAVEEVQVAIRELLADT